MGKNEDKSRIEIVDKERSMVMFKLESVSAVDKGHTITLQVKDDTSEKAFETFKKMKAVIDRG